MLNSSRRFFFQVEELLGEVHINLLGIHQTAGFIPESILLFQTVFSQFHNLRRGVDAFSLADNRDQKFAEFIGFLLGLLSFFQVSTGSKMIMVSFGSKCSSARQIRSALILPVLLLVNTVDGLVAGVGDLFGVLRKFDLWRKGGASCIFDSSQLLDAAESGVVLLVIRLVPTPQN